MTTYNMEKLYLVELSWEVNFYDKVTSYELVAADDKEDALDIIETQLNNSRGKPDNITIKETLTRNAKI